MGFWNRKDVIDISKGYADKKTLHENLSFAAVEQYKLLRANLRFMLPEDVKCPVIGITSSIRGEGKSTTAVNLCYVMADENKRILLIDGDLRLPSVAKKMRISNVPGITDILMEGDYDMESFQHGLKENWFIIPSGDIPPNPSELLGSSRMAKTLEQLRKEFDCIVIDLPPVNLVSDAVSISKLIDGMVVVIRESYTERRELDQCFRQLKLANTRILGCVMTGSGDWGESDYKYKRKKYYNYRSYYGDKPKK